MASPTPTRAPGEGAVTEAELEAEMVARAEREADRLLRDVLPEAPTHAENAVLSRVRDVLIRVIAWRISLHNELRARLRTRTRERDEREERLATAEARGRAAGLEEAAKVVRKVLPPIGVHPEHCGECIACHVVAAIRALATITEEPSHAPK